MALVRALHPVYVTIFPPQSPFRGRRRPDAQVLLLDEKAQRVPEDALEAAVWIFVAHQLLGMQDHAMKAFVRGEGDSHKSRPSGDLRRARRRRGHRYLTRRSVNGRARMIGQVDWREIKRRWRLGCHDGVWRYPDEAHRVPDRRIAPPVGDEALDALRGHACRLQEQRREVGVVDERVEDHDALQVEPPVAEHLEGYRIPPDGAGRAYASIRRALAPMERVDAVFEQAGPVSLAHECAAIDLRQAGDEIGDDDAFLSGKREKPTPDFLIREFRYIHTFHRLTVVNDSDRPPLLPYDRRSPKVA